MSQRQPYKGHTERAHQKLTRADSAVDNDFVLEKGIFNNIFEKDIRRVFIYKKAERLAKALNLIVPAFADSPTQRNRIDAIAVGLVDAALLPPTAARTALSRELLALSSILSIARTSGVLSAMNVDLIVHEAQTLLHEIAAYEEPRLFLDDAPTLSGIAKGVAKQGLQTDRSPAATAPVRSAQRSAAQPGTEDKGHQVKDTTEQNPRIKDRREGVLAVLRSKGRASMKDISTHVRGVSEKTIQRELAVLIDEGIVAKEGERRWSVYFLA